MKKWLLTILLICCLPFQTNAQTTFHDVNANSEMGQAVSNLVNRGIISGYPDGTYRPNQAITRAQAAKILAGILKLDTKSANATFTDVPISYEHYGAIAALSERKIINGYPDGTFKPSEPITRAQMAKILTNAFELSSVFETLPFTDVNTQSESYRYINALYSYAITTGTSASTYSPGNRVTRGQLAVFMTRAENTNKQSILLNMHDEGYINIANWSSNSDIVHVVTSGNELHLLPRKVGTGHLLVTGNSNLTTVQQTAYILFKVNVKDVNGQLQLTAEKSNLTEGLTHNAYFYTYDSLQLNFVPTAVEMTNVHKEQVPTSYYFVGRGTNGIELSVYQPGTYQMTLRNGTQAKTFTVHVEIEDFETVLTIYFAHKQVD